MNSMQMGAKAKQDPKADHWKTPSYILTALNEFWPDGWFDPCPSNPDFDGLSISWPERSYINPPFSQYREWSSHGALQPLEQIWMSHHNHDSRWFKSLTVSAMCLLFDRVKFINPETGQPGSTAIGKCQTLRYRGSNIYSFKRNFEHLGQIVEVL